MSRIVIPSSTDWLQSADFTSGTVLVDGRLAEMLQPDLWRDAVLAFDHTLDPRPWDYSGAQNHGQRSGEMTDLDDAWRTKLTIGTQGRITVPDRASLDFGTAVLFSGSAWIKTGIASTQAVFGKLGDSNDENITPGFSFSYNATANAMRLLLLDSDSGAAYTAYDGTTDVADDAWHHVGFTVRSRNATPGANDARVFVDGVTEGSLNTSLDAIGTDTDVTNDIDLTIGLSLFGGSHTFSFIGQHTGLMLHRRALSDRDIQLLAERRGVAYECRLVPKVFCF